MGAGIVIPDGNKVIQDDVPAIVGLIERTARWVDPETFRQLPVWAPHTARGKPLFDASWTRRYTNTNRSTGTTSKKIEGNVAALNALVAALDVARPRPKNWTVCHIWGYDDPSYAQQSAIVQDPRYYSCVANMVWLPTALKGFTDTVPKIKKMLRVCAFYLYGWACDHPTVASETEDIRAGNIPRHYPQSWPTALRREPPPRISPYSPRVAREIERRKRKIKECLENTDLVHYPRDEVRAVLHYWRIAL
jgi:hypothetical protein